MEALRLRTFGSLELEGSGFGRPKPLLVLAYLALEGPTARRDLAELFWLGAAHPLGSLSVALSQLRKVSPELFEADDHKVATTITSDAAGLLEAVEAGDPERALGFYRGRFLDGLQLPDWGVELEEWVYRTREFLGDRAREALLQLAEGEAARGRFGQAAQQAERAYLLTGAAEPEPETLERILALLVAGANPRAGEVRREAESFGLHLALTPEEARARWTGAGAAGKTHPRHNLLPAAAPLVGRDLELTELASQLTRPDCRLLTLTGIGGMGKTRLALRAAREQLEQHQDVFFVPLETLVAPELIPAAVAEALGLALHDRSDPLDDIAAFVADRSMLIVLDNFEHLLGGATQLPRLLEACPQLKLLVTSRERLNLSEEWVFPLAGLAFPPPDGPDLSDAARFDAVRLFVQRARRARPGFTPDDGDLRWILRICELVEGSPLGLELAAVWTRLLPPEDIAEEIEKNLDFLSEAPRDATPRQRSIRATFDYSWQLLAAREQEALSRLSVFRGGFLRQAAAEVAGAGISLLASLIDKSLLRVGERGRYQRHPLLHQYMAEKLAEHPELQASTREAHGLHFRSFLLEHAGELRLRKGREPLQAIEADFDNIAAAWQWAVQAGRIEVIQQMAGPLRAFCDVTAKLQGGEALFREVVAGLDGAEPDQQTALGNALVSTAYFGMRLGHTERAAREAEQGLRLLNRAHQPGLAITALHTLAGAVHRAGDYRKARDYAEDALRIARDEQDEDLISVSLKHLAILEKTLENLPDALRYNLEALELARRRENSGSAASILSNLGGLYLTMGRPRDAQQTLREGLGIARELGYEQVMPFLFSNLAIASHALGDHEGARSTCLEALELTRQHGEKGLEAGLLATLGQAETALARFEEAREHLVESLRISWVVGDTPLVLEALTCLAALWSEQGLHQQAEELADLVYRHPAALKGSRKLAGELRAGPAAKDPGRPGIAELRAWVVRILEHAPAVPEAT